MAMRAAPSAVAGPRMSPAYGAHAASAGPRGHLAAMPVASVRPGMQPQLQRQQPAYPRQVSGSSPQSMSALPRGGQQLSAGSTSPASSATGLVSAAKAQQPVPRLSSASQPVVSASGAQSCRRPCSAASSSGAGGGATQRQVPAAAAGGRTSLSSSLNQAASSSCQSGSSRPSQGEGSGGGLRPSNSREVVRSAKSFMDASVRQKMEEIARRAEAPLAAVGQDAEKASKDGQADSSRKDTRHQQDRSEIEDLRRKLMALESAPGEKSSGGCGQGSPRLAENAASSRSDTGSAAALRLANANITATAETRCSSPGAESRNSQGLDRCSAVASLKERQLAELRAQVARCGKLYGLSNQGEGPKSPPSAVSTDLANLEPERTGTRSPSQAFSASRTAGTLEEELAWTVQQMEVHRRTIEAHQRQLSILERRHAELITVLTKGSSLGGTPGSSVAGKLFSVEGGDGPGNLGAAAASAYSEVCSNSSSGGFVGGSSLGFAGAMAAAEARLGLRGSRNHSRPASGGSALSGPGSLAAAREGGSRGTPLMQRVDVAEEDTSSPLPNGRSGPSSAGSPEGANLGSLASSAFGKEREAELVAKLLKEVGARRQLRVPFVPIQDAPAQEGGEGGVPYLHGSLEVRLMVSEDGNRLLVRVSNSGNGKFLEVHDFLARAEAIEAKRRSPRPNTIAEEEQFNSSERSDHLSHSGVLTGSQRQGSSLLSQSKVSAPSSPMPGSGASSLASGALGGSSQTWKSLFKAHWPSR
eukprot:TRINITY_DN18594_c0_g1_i1.p1 TRINITY_DN18594_c0_g1~~TRINITY_DN18594_c0_g1_i1.p1  ORF type:complete len:770 (+),score=148.97 TRINITY_DN18594_c0_g1_i1:40-2310(+)